MRSVYVYLSSKVLITHQAIYIDVPQKLSWRVVSKPTITCVSKANFSSALFSACFKIFAVAAMDWAGPPDAVREELRRYSRGQHRFVITRQTKTKANTLGLARCSGVCRNLH